MAGALLGPFAMVEIASAALAATIVGLDRVPMSANGSRRAGEASSCEAAPVAAPSS